MAKIVDTSITGPEDLTAWERDQIYNGMDVLLPQRSWKYFYQN